MTCRNSDQHLFATGFSFTRKALSRSREHHSHSSGITHKTPEWLNNARLANCISHGRVTSFSSVALDWHHSHSSGITHKTPEWLNNPRLANCISHGRVTSFSSVALDWHRSHSSGITRIQITRRTRVAYISKTDVRAKIS